MSYASQHSNLPTGPFSGVNLSSILDKTTLESEVVFEADARALEQYGSGMKIEEQDGRTVAVTEDGFSGSSRNCVYPTASIHHPDKLMDQPCRGDSPRKAAK